MFNEEVHSILNNVLLAFQVCLGLWQFLKLTPVGALLKGVAGWLLRPLGLSPNYALLQSFKGRVFKEVTCCVTKAEDPVVFSEMTEAEGQITTGKTSISRPLEERSEWNYLGVVHVLEKKEGNKLFIDGKMSYYITDFIWDLLTRRSDNGGAVLMNLPVGVFIKGCKEFWKGVAIGGVMTAEEVLDYIILENHVTKVFRSHYLLLPVDWTVSEEKLLKILNTAGLFFQAKKVYWPIPLFFSLTSAILEFGTPLRKWLYGNFNLMFCCAMHLIIDQFPYPVRSKLYSLGNWVENLKPSNDVKSKVVRGRIGAVIGGGAKTHKEDATLVPREYFSGQQREFQASSIREQHQVEQTEDIQPDEHRRQEERDDPCVEWTFNCGDLRIRSFFRRRYGYCNIRWTERKTEEVNSSQPDDYIEFKLDSSRYINVRALLSCIARNESGSLKCSTRNGSRVQVRGLKESILCCAKNNFPPVYDLHFDNAIAN